MALRYLPQKSSSQASAAPRSYCAIVESAALSSPVPMIVASPAYMPGAWALVILQMGMVAHWLRGKPYLALCQPMSPPPFWY